MMQYYELTDPLRRGEIIRQEGRKHYRFSFGAFQWERTTLFQAYLTEGTAEYRRCRECSEEEAQTALLERGKEISRMLKKAERIAEQAHAYQTDEDGVPYIAHIRSVVNSLTDWEEQTAAWLHELCNESGWTPAQLRREGFSGKLCRSVELLTLRSGVSYGAYLTQLRQDRIARRVKIADLASLIVSAEKGSAVTPEAVEQCRIARKYLFGDLADYSEQADLRRLGRAKRRFVPTEAVYAEIRSAALGGRKLPHGVSNPVLYRAEERLFLAFFVYTYRREQLRQGAIGRPVSWILADIGTGQLLEEIPCSIRDFSSANSKERFSTANPNPPQDNAFFCRIYAILDKVRKGFLSDGTIRLPLYEQYLEQMLTAVPPAYHRFYQELSNP